MQSCLVINWPLSQRKVNTNNHNNGNIKKAVNIIIVNRHKVQLCTEMIFCQEQYQVDWFVRYYFNSRLISDCLPQPLKSYSWHWTHRRTVRNLGPWNILLFFSNNQGLLNLPERKPLPHFPHSKYRSSCLYIDKMSQFRLQWRGRLWTGTDPSTNYMPLPQKNLQLFIMFCSLRPFTFGTQPFPFQERQRQGTLKERNSLEMY